MRTSFDSGGLGKWFPEVSRLYRDFDKALTAAEYNSPRYAYRLCFTKKLVNRPGQADRVVEFISPDSELAKCIAKEYWVKKEVERPKFRAKRRVCRSTKGGVQEVSNQSGACGDVEERTRQRSIQRVRGGHRRFMYWYESGSSAARHCAKTLVIATVRLSDSPPRVDVTRGNGLVNLEVSKVCNLVEQTRCVVCG